MAHAGWVLLLEAGEALSSDSQQPASAEASEKSPTSREGQLGASTKRKGRRRASQPTAIKRSRPRSRRSGCSARRAKGGDLIMA